MKVMTILGTRPEIIRLSRVIPKLDELCSHVLVHTGQNYDPNLNQIFFDELGLRAPDITFDTRSATTMGQIAKILEKTEEVMIREHPDRLLLLGDTNSALSAMVAKRMGIPVYHMEAGNRCFDDRVPEEVNRRVVDHSSDVLMPYTERSRQNLLREGIPSNRIYVTGNPILEVLTHYNDCIESSDVLRQMSLEKGHYFLITLHRSENVDDQARLESFARALDALHKRYGLPVIWSVHPRTRDKLNKSDVEIGKGVRMIEPLGLFDFVHLEKNAKCVLNDSGTVQEECCIFHIPSVTLRDVTERPETIEAGSNILSGADADSIERCTKMALDRGTQWRAPAEYSVTDVSSTVLNILAGHRQA